MSFVYYIVMLLIVLLLAIFIGFLNWRRKRLLEEIDKQRQKVYKISDVLKNINKEKQKQLYEKVNKYTKGIYISVGLVTFFMTGTIIILFFSGLSQLWKSDEEEQSQEGIKGVFLAEGGEKIINDPKQITKKQSLKAAVTGILKDKLFFSWYEESAKAAISRRLFYKTEVNKLLDGQSGQDFLGSSSEEPAEVVKYNENISKLNKIENEKVPEGYSREDVEKGLIEPRSISADQYLEEYSLRMECYMIRPEIAMLQQVAKAAEDAVIKLSEDTSRTVEMVESVSNAVTNYLCLMRYKEAGESKADCCYWIAKAFCVLSENLPKEWDEIIEHCRLMSYAFCEKGVDYLDTLKEKNDHEDKLRQLFDTMDVRTAQYVE